MKSPVIVIGLGEMGSVFARGLLRAGYPVIPALRDTNLDTLAQENPQPAAVLIAVAEGDLQAVLSSIPEIWKDRIILLQNELLPRDWAMHELTDPTIISVWFEKKKGQDVKVLIPSPCFGPLDGLLVDALATLDIPARAVATDADLLFELVLKNIYIITTNVAGLKVGGTVGELWEQHQQLTRGVANDVMTIQSVLANETFPSDALINGMLEAFEGDLQHNCMGRSAPARLQRAIEQSDDAGLDVPHLRAIQT